MSLSARSLIASLSVSDASANEATHGVVVETDELAVVRMLGEVVALVKGATC